MVFPGYDTSQVREVKFKTYTANGNFDELLDSFTVELWRQWWSYNAQWGNTMYLPVEFQAGKDYTFKFLPEGTDWSVSELQYQTHAVQLFEDEKPVTHSQCPVASLKIDGKRFQFPEQSEAGLTWVEVRK